ncbi:MAG: 4'-phosphopantetheinyl transferase superfamily protein [Bacteroidaceae bacterium]|nr:4'-phosphopantetheinyl transferase superfamily protein [Bacteroidaceae bacterium]
MLYINDHIGDFPEKLVEKAISLLPSWRREQALKFKHPEGRKECALAYLELCRGLMLEYDICEMPPFSYNENGKPLLQTFPNIHFSLSHCKEAVSCFLSDAPCGLDVECIRPAKETLVRYCMNDEECQQIFSSPSPDVAFISLWTQKEAVFKLKGTGINDDIKNILSPENVRDITIQTIANLYRGYILSAAQYATKTKIQLWK